MGYGSDSINILVDMSLNCHDDVDRYGRAIHGVTLKTLLEDRLPRDMFINKEFISHRELFNNLDGDDRAGLSLARRDNAGRVIGLAGASLVISYIDDEQTDIPSHISALLQNPPYGDWLEFFDAEFNLLCEEAYDNICAFLFGMVLNHDTENETSLRYDIHSVIEDLLYGLILELSAIVEGIEDVFGSMCSSDTAYPIAYWYEHYMLVNIVEETRLPNYNDRANTLFDYLKYRGYIDGPDSTREHRWRPLRITENNRSLWERGSNRYGDAPLFRR